MKTNSANLIVFLSLFAFASGIKVDLFRLSIVGNDEPGATACSILGGNLGPTILSTLDVIAPWMTEYEYSDSSNRHLRQTNFRRLKVNMCAKSFCSKPRNWNWCYWNSCRCTCGNRRLLVKGILNESALHLVRRTLKDLVAAAAATIPGCELGLLMTRHSIDDSEL